MNELAIEGAERAANNAGEDWKATAYDALIEYASKHKTFRVEDVRAAYPHVDNPPDKRAWGYVASRARREGKIKFVEWTKADSPTVHGRVCALWETIGDDNATSE